MFFAAADFPSRHLNGVNNPGYWTCSRADRHTRLQMVLALNFGEREAARGALDRPEYRQEMLASKALIHSFGVTLPEACHMGN